MNLWYVVVAKKNKNKGEKTMGELIKKGFGKLVSVEPNDERKSDED